MKLTCVKVLVSHPFRCILAQKRSGNKRSVLCHNKSSCCQTMYLSHVFAWQSTRWERGDLKQVKSQRLRQTLFVYLVSWHSLKEDLLHQARESWSTFKLGQHLAKGSWTVLLVFLGYPYLGLPHHGNRHDRQVLEFQYICLSRLPPLFHHFIFPSSTAPQPFTAHSSKNQTSAQRAPSRRA